MTLWQRPVNPIDRAVRELDREIAALKKRSRRLAHQQPPAARSRPADGKAAATSGREDEPPASDSFSRFVSQMLAPGPRADSPSYCSIRDLLDVGGSAISQLQEPPAEAARDSQPDLFSHAAAMQPQPGAQPLGQPLAGGSARARPSADAQEKLAHYLSAGTLRSHKPLKRAQREARNRFLMWIGLSCVALWMIYLITT
jgi:hypothetical protein